jgi:uncharacterized membrane protein
MFKIFKKPILIPIMIFFYTIIFSYAMIIKFYALKTYAYDLGNYNQALYTTLFGHKILYYTADLPATGGSMLAVHFCPILLMILPFYAIYPAPPTLLVLKSFILGLGALPVYWLAAYFLKNKYWGYLFAAIYLLNPALQGINWFDFHPEAFFPTFCLFSLYYGFREKWLQYVLCSILTLTTTEYAAVLVLIESLYFLWVKKKETIDSLKALKNLRPRNISKQFIYPFLTMILAIIWFLIAIKVITLFSSKNPMIHGGAPQWSILGAEGTLSIPLRILLAPQKAIAALAYDFPIKMVYLVIIFGSTAFFALLSPKSLIMTLPWLIAALFSNYYPFYYIGNQYPAFLLPYVMVGSIIGAKKILELGKRKDLQFMEQRKLACLMLAVALFFSLLSSPLYGLHLGNWPDLTYGLDRITKHEEILMCLLRLIPQNASILTQQNIFPLVSSRINAFVIPLGSFYPPGTSFNSTLNEWITRCDFILVDLKTSVFETYLVYTYINTYANNSFKVYASSDGIILLRRDFRNEPYIFDSYKVTLNWINLTLINGDVVLDSDSTSQRVFLHKEHQEPLNDFCRGSIVLPPGEYKATFRLKTTNNSSSEKIAVISVFSFPFVLKITKFGDENSGHKYFFELQKSDSTVICSKKILFGRDFSKPNVYEEFNLTFSISTPAAIEFDITDVSENTNLFLDLIKVIQLKALP